MRHTMRTVSSTSARVSVGTPNIVFAHIFTPWLRQMSAARTFSSTVVSFSRKSRMRWLPLSKPIIAQARPAPAICSTTSGNLQMRSARIWQMNGSVRPASR